VAGKVPASILTKYVYTRLGVRDPSVVVGPAIGEDAAIIDLGDGRVLVVHNDAITGAVEFLGWLAVHIVCNDVAVRGAKPRWFLMSLFLPEESGERILDAVMDQVDRAAKELGVMVVGGHTEFTPGLDKPIVGTTAIGLTSVDRYVRTGGAREGDVIVMTKTAAIEGTAILSADFAEELRRRGVSVDVIERGREYLKNVSVVKEALLLAENRLATSMHDPTEGGILGGLAEMAYASGRTFVVWEERIPISRETLEISNALGVDPLRLISSGVLLATVPRDRAPEALRILEANGVKASVIGEVKEFTGSLLVLHRRGGRAEEVRDVHVEDELFRLWKEIRVRY